jgi:hypothetical protein
MTMTLHTKTPVDDYTYERAVRFLRNFHSQPGLRELPSVDEDESCSYITPRRGSIRKTQTSRCLVSLGKDEKAWGYFMDDESR